MTDLNDKTILIVDDSATTRAVIKRAIRMSGTSDGELLEAADGEAALRLLGTRTIALVMTDLNMPVMDGYELIRRIRATGPIAGMPIVVISAQPDPSRVEELRRPGVCGYLPKPFTPEDVRDVLAAA